MYEVSYNQVEERMSTAAYTKTFQNLMGGTQIGIDGHALDQCKKRYYSAMTMDLLAENVKDLLASIPELEDELMDIHEGAKFGIYREEDGFVVLAAFGINKRTQNIMVFVHTILGFPNARRRAPIIFYEEYNELLLKLGVDGTVTKNAVEFQLRTPR